MDMNAAAEAMFPSMKADATPQTENKGSGDWLQDLADQAKAHEQGNKPNADSGNANQSQPVTDEAINGALAEVAKELGVAFDANSVSKEFVEIAKARKLDGAAVKELAKVHYAEQQKAWQTTQAGWKQAATTDKEFGGDAFKGNVAVAKAALDKFGTPELKALLGQGIGNHPEVIRFMVRVGKALR